MCGFDLICFQETWFSPEISDSEIIGNTDYRVIRNDRINSLNKRKRGGGVAILIRTNYTAYQLLTDEKTIMEAVAVRIVDEKYVKNICVANFYLPPTGNRREMVLETERFLSCIKRKYPNDILLIVGDFNFPNILWQFNDGEIDSLSPCGRGHLKIIEKLFLDKIFNTGVSQLNSNPNGKNTFLDLVFCNFTSFITVETPDKSQWLDKESIYHRPIEIIIHEGPSNFASRDGYKLVKNIKFKDITAILSQTNFDFMNLNEVSSFENCNEVCSAFVDFIVKIQNSCTKVTKMKISTGMINHPWTRTKKFRKLHRVNRYCQRKYRNNPCPHTKAQLRFASVNLYIEYSAGKNKHYSDLITNVGGNSKLLYDAMRTKTKAMSNLPLIMIDNGEFFAGNRRYTKLMSKLMESFTDDQNPLGETNQAFHNELSDIHLRLDNSNYSHLWENYEHSFTTEEVEKCIKELKNSKDSGPMAIEVQIFKKNSAILAPLICTIFNNLLQFGFFPNSWKKSFLIPLPKKGNNQDLANYRGICIQSTLPKIFDKLLTKKITNHLIELVPSSQHGFCPKRSTVSNLLEFSSFVHDQMAQKSQVHAVYFDFSRAFDMINHRTLAEKLAKMSMPLKLLQTTIDFVRRRRYALKTNGEIQSEYRIAPSSVPQGSHAGPLLFILFVSDLVNCLEGNTRCLSYADDVKFYAAIKSSNDRIFMQSSIDKLVTWANVNKLRLNHTKTNFMVFGAKVRADEFYFVGIDRINRCTTIRDLGVHFDEAFTFKLHIERLTIKLKQLNGIAFRFCKEVHYRLIMKKLTKTYLLPIAEYCSVIWSQNRVGVETLLEKPLHNISRYVLGAPYHTFHPQYVSFSTRMRRLQLLNFGQRRTIARITVAHKLFHLEIDTPCGEWLRNRRNPTTITRNPPIFTLKRNDINNKSPLQMMANEVNKFRHIFSFFEDSSATIKKKLVIKFMNE